MKNILPDTSRPTVTQLKMSDSAIHKNVYDVLPSFNGMHTMYESSNAAVLFSTFTQNVIREMASSNNK